MAVGIDFRTAPGSDRIVALSEDVCLAGVDEDATRRETVLLVFFSALAALSFFFSTLANVSANHGAFTFPRDTGGLLVHWAEPASPAISAIERLLRTELSYLSMSYPFSAYSSCFLISSHSVPLLPGRRPLIWINAKSPLSFCPCSRILRSPFCNIAAASASVPATYFPFTGCGESGSQVPTSQTMTVPAP